MHERGDVAEGGQLRQALHALRLLRAEAGDGRRRVGDDALHAAQQVVELDVVRRLAAATHAYMMVHDDVMAVVQLHLTGCAGAYGGKILTIQ